MQKDADSIELEIWHQKPRTSSRQCLTSPFRPICAEKMDRLICFQWRRNCAGKIRQTDSKSKWLHRKIWRCIIEAQQCVCILSRNLPGMNFSLSYLHPSVPGGFGWHLMALHKKSIWCSYQNRNRPLEIERLQGWKVTWQCGRDREVAIADVRWCQGYSQINLQDMITFKFQSCSENQEPGIYLWDPELLYWTAMTWDDY